DGLVQNTGDDPRFIRRLQHQGRCRQAGGCGQESLRTFKMSDLTALYQELILDHSRHPRHVGKLADATHVAEGDNPLCGDRLTLFLKVENDVVVDARFDGEGCAISTASASLMTDNIIGKNINNINMLFNNFHKMVTVGNGDD